MKRFFAVIVCVACATDVKTTAVVASGAPTVSPSASVTPSATPHATPDATPLAIAITDFGGGRFQITNTSGEPIRVKTRASIERSMRDGTTTWAAIDDRIDLGSGYKLLERCGPSDACVEIAPGATLTPVRWTGMGCSGQCNFTCRANSYEGPGLFRLTVDACDSRSERHGPERSRLPDITNEGGVDRFALATDVDSAIAVRLERPSTAGFDASQPRATDRIAGFAIRTGTEKPLDHSALDALTAWLRAPKNFDDVTMKRCAVHDLVGVRLTRHPRTTLATPVTEIVDVAMDFACNKLLVAFGEGANRKAEGTLFDPSRPAILAWAKGVFAGDAEIDKLH